MHNCYSYAFNATPQATWSALQPGARVGIYQKNKPDNYTCPSVTHRVLADYATDNKVFLQQNCDVPCPEGYYQVGLAVDYLKDYHFFKQDGPDQWSHKLGPGAVQYLQENPRHMQHRTFENFNYDDWCGCFCVAEV